VAGEQGFDVAAEETDLQVRTTQPFAEGRSAGFLGPDPAANAFAFENEPGTVSPVRENSSMIYVAKVEEHVPAGPVPFETVRDRIRAEVAREMVLDRTLEAAQEIYAQVEAGTSPEEAVKGTKAQYDIQGPLSRNDFIKGGIGRDPEIVGAAFALKEVGEVSEPDRYQAGSAFVILRDRTEPDLTQFNEQQDSLYQTVKMEKQQELYSRWFQQLLDNSDVQNNLQRLSEPGRQASL
jgi:parvulin-like peptidyl-prolyl isomerase